VIVTCEKCHSSFKLFKPEIEKAKKEGRVLRCGNCHHMWLVSTDYNPFRVNVLTHSPLDDNLIKSIKLEKRPALTLMKAVKKPIKHSFEFTHIPIFLKSIFYGLCFILAFSLFVLNKNYLISAYPLSSTIYAILGLHNSDGLEFEKVKILKSSFLDNQPLIISGYVINRSSSIRLTPDIKITFLNKKGEKISSMLYKLNKKKIEPKEKSKISARINDIPANTEDVNLEIGNYLEFLYR
jgi:predicted Zn finger-like uncharacterized protein